MAHDDLSIKRDLHYYYPNPVSNKQKTESGGLPEYFNSMKTKLIYVGQVDGQNSYQYQAVFHKTTWTTSCQLGFNLTRPHLNAVSVLITITHPCFKQAKKKIESQFRSTLEFYSKNMTSLHTKPIVSYLDYVFTAYPPTMSVEVEAINLNHLLF